MTKTEYTDEDRHEARMATMPRTKEAMGRWKADMAEAIAEGDDEKLAAAAGHFFELAHQIEWAEAQEAFYQGETWTQIGKRHGITKQAAQQRFGKPYRSARRY